MENENKTLSPLDLIRAGYDEKMRDQDPMTTEQQADDKPTDDEQDLPLLYRLSRGFAEQKKKKDNGVG